MIEFVELRARTYSYLINGSGEHKKPKKKKKCFIKRTYKLENYKSKSTW